MRRMLIPALTGGLALLVLLTRLGPSGAARGDAVDDYVRKRMERERIPGLSLAVLRDGKVIKAAGYGYASLELRVPARPETVYELASSTKPLLAVAIMLLVQDGRLGLDDPVSKYVAGTPEAWQSITVRHLLSHTAGIKDYLRDLRRDFPHDATPEQIVRAAMDAPLSFPPGERWDYSNTGYVLLGTIVRKVTGATYDALLQERVFQPLGMASTRRDTPDEVVPNRATGYLWYGGQFHNADFLKFLTTNHGDRGILSTVLDLAKFDAALDGGLLTQASRDALWTPAARAENGASDEVRYGLGWFSRRFNGHRQLSHPGGAPGAAAIISRYPDDHLTVLLLANGGKAFPQALDLGIARHYIPGLFAGRTVALRPERLRAYAGYYNAYGSQLLRVEPDGAGLLLDDGGGVNNEFVPVSDSAFVAPEADRGFSVRPTAAGDVSGGTLRLGKDDLPVQRIGPLARTLTANPDPDPGLTREIEAILQAFAQGGAAVEAMPRLAPQARKDYARGPAPELAGIERISYLDSRDVAAQGIERHGARVSRVLYYRLQTRAGTRFVLVYLTADGLVTDQDVLPER
jgi:CubicO group peptidase (beta-lactamase class C family)